MDDGLKVTPVDGSIVKLIVSTLRAFGQLIKSARQKGAYELVVMGVAILVVAGFLAILGFSWMGGAALIVLFAAAAWLLANPRSWPFLALACSAVIFVIAMAGITVYEYACNRVIQCKPLNPVPLREQLSQRIWDPGSWGILTLSDREVQGLDKWLRDLHSSEVAPAAEHYRIGRAYHQLGNHVTAASHYTAALQSNPDSNTRINSHYMLGLALESGLEHEKASKEFESVVSLEPTHLGALYYLGVCWMWRRDYEGALKYFEKTLAADPWLLGARYNAGVSRLHLKRFGEALSDFDYVLASVPYFPKAVFNKGQALFALGRKEDALIQFGLALDLDESYRSRLLNEESHRDKIEDPEIGIRLKKMAAKELK